MKNTFIPKSLNAEAHDRVCLDVGEGACVTEPHFHNCAEVIYVMRGEARVFFDCEWHNIGEGTAFFVPPGCVHACVFEKKDSLRIVLGFREELICGDSSEVRLSLLPYLARGFRGKCIFTDETCPGLKDRMTRLLELSSGTSPKDVFILSSETVMIYHGMYSLWESEGDVTTRGRLNATVAAVEKFVKENCMREITAAECARQMNVSYSYMAKLLSENLGLGFCDLLLAARVDMAKRLLTDGDKSVTEIGYECGFCATSAFIAAFKRRTGITPLSYRKSATAHRQSVKNKTASVK